MWFLGVILFFFHLVSVPPPPPPPPPPWALQIDLLMNLFEFLFVCAVQALYQDTHPDYLNYIYLISPISFLIINPIGFTLMEIHRHRTLQVAPASSEATGEASSRRQRQDSTRSTDSAMSQSQRVFGPSGDGEGARGEQRTWGKALVLVIRGVALNPIVFMTAVGIAGNFIFNQKVPVILDNILLVLG